MPETEQLFRDDAYLSVCEAQVVGVNDRGGILLDRTNFYPTGGGQPGDSGKIERADGSVIEIATTVYGQDKSEIILVPTKTTSLDVGEAVTCHINWDRRHRLMRVHTAMHLLSAVLTYPVTGGSVGDGEGRLDFDIPDGGLDKQEITEKLNAIISQDHAVSFEWITDAELDANPELVKTLSVQPPRSSGKIRLIRIGDNVDLQPCGGTHVSQTGEIGEIVISKVEKKGRQNRRVRLKLVD